jgi:rSAM/selenodomain-associated transferase 2
MPFISIVIPVLNEQAQIRRTLDALLPLRQAGTEVIVVDGGSQDRTCRLAEGHCDRVLHASPGRASQMNRGASEATGEVLLFLHADTSLPEDAVRILRSTLEHPDAHWGRFDVRLSGSGVGFSIIAFCMNLRSRLSGIATGDQAMFVRRELFNQLQGYAPIELMEDIELSSRLKKHSAPVCLRQQVITSSRRWEEKGVVRTVLCMWSIRLAYFFGSSSASLAKRYDS